VRLAELVDQLEEQLLAPEDEFDEEEATVRTVFAWSYRALPAHARASSDEPPDRRRAAVHRMLTFYLLTACHAVARLTPARPPVPDLPAPNGVEPRTFDTDAEAMRWCEEERPVHRGTNSSSLLEKLISIGQAMRMERWIYRRGR
jgi:hypothetical protein